MSESKPTNDINTWEITNVVKPDLGVLRISKMPGDDERMALLIRQGPVMFPLAIFRNLHAARRFVAWMEGASEPEPTMEQEYQEAMAQLNKAADEAKGFVGVIGEQPEGQQPLATVSGKPTGPMNLMQNVGADAE